MNVSRRLILPTVSVMGLIAAAMVGPGAFGQQTAPTQTANVQKDVQASLVIVPAEVPADAARNDFLLAGNKAGVLRLWVTQDGARRNFFASNDRGRGPSITDNDYLKGPVDEHFRIASGKATWSNKSEKGDKQLGGPPFAAFYVPIDAVLIRSPI